MSLHDDLAPLVDDRYLARQKHPEYDLWLYNYTQKTQFNKHWTPLTLMARGLILDANGDIVARPFPKFFNWSEMPPGWQPSSPLTGLQAKMDGSLGILYWTPDGLPSIATRGSFVSQQAQHATGVLRERYVDLPWRDDETYLFEIIYPGNRIVIDYGQQDDLVLLAVRGTATGTEHQLPDWFPNRVEQTRCVDLDAAMGNLAALPRNTEGIVLLFEDGSRLKMKTDEYVRLHRLLTGLTPRRIWELVSTGVGIDELLRHIPEEFADWVRTTARGLHHVHEDTFTRAYQDAVSAEQEHSDDRGAIARAIQDNPLRSLIFLILDGKDIDQPVWRMIRPEHSVPYTADPDEQQVAA